WPETRVLVEDESASASPSGSSPATSGFEHLECGPFSSSEETADHGSRPWGSVCEHRFNGFNDSQVALAAVAILSGILLTFSSLFTILRQPQSVHPSIVSRQSFDLSRTAMVTGENMP